MIAIAVIGLLILAGAAALGVSGVLGNRGAGHQIAGGFHAFGHTFHGSSGQLFFWGLVAGAAGFLGLMLLVAGLRGRSGRSSRAGQSAVHHEPQHAAAPVAEPSAVSTAEPAPAETAERPDDELSSRAHGSSSVPAQASENADS